MKVDPIIKLDRTIEGQEQELEKSLKQLKISIHALNGTLGFRTLRVTITTLKTTAHLN